MNTPEHTPWTCTDSTIVHQNPWYKVRHDKVIRPDGSQGNYFVVDKPLSVYIVALLEGKVVMVEQYRYTTNHLSTELPAGGADDDLLSSLQVAQKEFAEETGYDAQQWTKVGTVDHLNGYTNERADIYLATGLVPTTQDVHQDDSEFITVKTITWERVWDMIYNGEIKCAGSITGLTLARPHVEAYLKTLS